MDQQVLAFYESVVSCPNTTNECPHTINCIDADYPPRGFMSGGTPGNIDILIVGKNPGHILENEKGAYAGKTAREIADKLLRKQSWNIPPQSSADNRSYTFHRNLMRYVCYFLDISEDQIFKRCVYSNLVKCSTTNETGNLNSKTINECFHNHFKNEIRLWNPKVLLALGRESFGYLNKEGTRSTHGKPVIYVKHPSYYYRKDRESMELKAIKDKIREYVK